MPQPILTKNARDDESRIEISLQLDFGTPEDDLQALVSDFEKIGAKAEVGDGIIQLSIPEVVAWTASATVIGVPLATFFKKYAEVLGEEAARSTSAGIRWLWSRIKEKRGSRGEMTITGMPNVTVLVNQDVPESAFDELDAVDLQALSNGMLHWDGAAWMFTPTRGETSLAPRRDQED